MEAEGSALYSQGSAIGSCLEPDEFNPHPLQVLLLKFCMCFLFFPCPAHLILH